MGLTVAKVGGSLYDLPDLRGRLVSWVEGVAPPVLLVPGGGPAADVIRELDRVHRLGEEQAHWLALRTLAVSAHFLAGLLGVPVVRTPADRAAPLAVLDPHAFCQGDDSRPGAVPHGWKVTSDSIAARVAEDAGARLVLLKSVDLPAGTGWEAAGAAGVVDEAFAALVGRAGLAVEWINLRSADFLPR